MPMNVKVSDNEKLIETRYRGRRVPIVIRKRSKSDPEQVKEVFRDDVYGSILDEIGLRDEVVVDVGAYIGDTVVLFGLHRASKVYAFEPHPTLYRLAVKNARLNRVRFNIRCVGLSDKRERLDVMGRATRSFGHGKGPFLDPTKDHHHQEIKLVSARKEIRRILTIEQGIQLLKVDCEGYETRVLPSIAKELESVEHLVVECHGKKRLTFVQQFLSDLQMKIRGPFNVYAINANEMWTLHATW